MRQIGALQHTGGSSDDAATATGYRGAVLPVPHKTRAKLTRATVHDRKPRGPDQRIQLPFKHFVAYSEFAATAGVVADIQAAAGTLITEDRDPGQPAEGVARVLGSKYMGSHK